MFKTTPELRYSRKFSLALRHGSRRLTDVVRTIMKVCKSPLPENSRIGPLPRRQLTADCSAAACNSGKDIPEPGDGGILDDQPGMAEVSLPAARPAGQAFGLKTGEGPQPGKTGRSPEQRRKLRFMSVAERTAGRKRSSPWTTRHLVAYMSIYIEGGEVFASTVVKYHNKLGVVYSTSSVRSTSSS